MDSNQVILNDFITKHPFATAKALEVMGSKEVSEFLLALPLPEGLNLLSLMNPEQASECFVLFPAKQRTEYMEKGKPSVMAAILKMVDYPVQSDLFKGVSPGTAIMIRRELQFKPNTVGPLAEPAITVHKTMSVDNAIEIIKRSRTNADPKLYVVDLDGIFQGLVEPTELLISARTDTLEGIMIKTCPRFSADQPTKSILQDKAWLQYRYVPVVDRTDKFIGSISYSSLLEIAGRPEGRAKDTINETAGALGELYRIGLTSLIQTTGK